MLRHCSSRAAGLLIAWCLVSGAQAGQSSACAQEATPRLVPPAACDDGYWIVSARDCDPDVTTSQCRNFKLWRYDARGRGRPATLAEFYASLTPGVPVCFMMHGSFVDWETVREDSRLTNQWLRSPCPGQPLHVVCFTWPSDDTPKLWLPIDVAILGRRAGRHALYVAELISMIPDDHPICLLGHSHGARMTVSTLHVLGGGTVDGVAFAGGPYHRHRLRAVLAAGAFDHHWLNPGQRYERAVHRPEGILNLLNRRDMALGFYPLHRPLTTVAAVARSGFTRGDRQEIGPASRKIIDLDVTDQVRAGHIWPHYYGDRSIAQRIAPYIFFEDPQTPAVARTTPATELGTPLTPVNLESHRSSKWELMPSGRTR